MSNLIYLVDQLMNGLLQGSIYALVAIGYMLIVGIVGLPTFAYGDIVMCGAYIAHLVFSVSEHANPIIVFLAVFLGTAILGILMDKLCYEPFFDSPRHISLMCTIGMSTILKNVVQILTDSTTVSIPEMFGSWSVELGNYYITASQVWVFGIVIVLCICFTLFLTKTKTGVQIRAVSQNKKAANLVGINVNRIILLGNALGCGMGGLAGLLYAVYYNSFRATMGGAIGMKAFIVSVLSGFDNILTASIASVIIGVVESIGIALTTSGYRDIFAFVFLIVILIINPTGLAGNNRSAMRKIRQSKE